MDRTHLGYASEPLAYGFDAVGVLKGEIGRILTEVHRQIVDPGKLILCDSASGNLPKYCIPYDG